MNYTGTARSNYVKLKDFDGLVNALEPFPISIEKRVDGTVCLLSQDSGGWPSEPWDGGEDEDEDGGRPSEYFDPLTHLCPFLEDGQVIVLMEVGNEGYRYLVGAATAYTWDGRHISISIDQIYEQAESLFSVSGITHAEY